MNKFKIFGVTGLFASALFLSGCLGGGFPSFTDDGSSNVSRTTVGEHDVYVPDEFSKSNVSGDFSGFAISAGKSAITSRSTKSVLDAPVVNLKANLRETTVLTTSSRDVMGFISNTKALNSETDVSGLRTSYESAIRNNSSVYVATLTNAGFYTVDPALFAGTKQPSSAAYGLYRLTTYTDVGVTEVAEMLAEEIGVNVVNGTVNFPSPASDESQVTDFVVFLGLIYYSATDVVVMATVVPYELTGSYQGLTKAATQPTNVAPKGTQRASTSQTFTQAAVTNNKADFLFVIDNSGSMGDEQTAISDIADDFENAVTSANLDYRVGVITTDSDALRDTYVDGGFTDDITEFKSDIVAGTSGSPTESGIWFAEQALQPGGTVETDGYPRSGASLSVIMISDEDDQYSSYSPSSSSFDASNNLFIDNSYSVYSIIDDSYSYYNTDYSDLASNTGGSVADIKDKTSYSLIMTEIAQAASGSASLFTLNEKAIAGSVKVSVNGVAVSEDASNGFQLVNNNIVFYGTSKPEAGDSIAVQYEYFE